jgi:malate dehydrogenase (oxaloacetate-decarboxylating)(NADP+)
MKQAAVRALAELARLGEAEGIPDAVRHAYPNEDFHFGPSYIIPKPFDSRVLLHVAPAVAEAAVASGVSRLPLEIASYRRSLEKRLVEISSL